MASLAIRASYEAAPELTWRDGFVQTTLRFTRFVSYAVRRLTGDFRPCQCERSPGDTHGATPRRALAMTMNAGVTEAMTIRDDRRSYQRALAECDVLGRLARFDPRVAGTPPLGLDLPDSDIDVLCFAPDARAFTDTVWHNFSNAPAFTAKQLMRHPRPVVASFDAAGWRIEIYGEAIPVEQQRGWRHFAVERRLLALGGEHLAVAVLAQRGQGMKTEPAFAAVLGLRGDPYLALLDLGEQDDETLISALRAGGFAVAAPS